MGSELLEDLSGVEDMLELGYQREIWKDHKGTAKEWGDVRSREGHRSRGQGCMEG